MGIKTRVVETDGTELVVVKRTDIGTDDPKRKTLALADNATSDNVEWDFDNIGLDSDVLNVGDWDIVVPETNLNDNQEIDTDDFEDEQELKLKFTSNQYAFVLSKLREYGDDFSNSLLLILGYDEQV